MRQFIIAFLIFIFLTCFLEACRFSLACNLKITGKYIESSCGLTNGVRFEELIVDAFYADGKPKIYKVICSYSANPYANGPANKVEDRIYFDGQQGDCYWWKDSATNGVYRNFEGSRKRIKNVDDISQDSIVETKTDVTEDSMIVTGGKPFLNIDLFSERVRIKCPLKFKSSTWYYVDFSDQQYEAFLYVDSNMTYNLYQIDKTTNF